LTDTTIPPAIAPAAEKLCACGEGISRFSTRCWKCADAAVIAAAERVEPSTPLCIVGSDTFFDDLDQAAEEYAGQFAHPCDKVPLHVRSKSLAEDLVERAVEAMCEEAFEDAEDSVNGAADLEAAFVAALDAFNAAQTASSWVPNPKQVFQIPAPAGADEAPVQGDIR